MAGYMKSMITDDLEHCYLCGKTPVQYHHVFGGSHRRRATADNLFIPLCWNCHVKVHNEPSQRLNYSLKRLGQLAYEDLYGHDEFMKNYGKNYL